MGLFHANATLFLILPSIGFFTIGTIFGNEASFMGLTTLEFLTLRDSSEPLYSFELSSSDEHSYSF